MGTSPLIRRYWKCVYRPFLGVLVWFDLMFEGEDCIFLCFPPKISPTLVIDFHIRMV